MLKTIIVLPDGTELYSGIGTENAIQSITITECVNDSQELNLGSTCANMVEAKLITPGGGLPIAAGDELAVYKEDETGIRHKVGLFTTEKPTRPGANTMSITAYDRISWLDKDLTLWLAGLDGWPYRLIDFARMVCEACNVSLDNDAIPNGEHLVQVFSADGITGRQLIQWAGQIAGRFCRATPNGNLEFAWYEPVSGYSIGKTDDSVSLIAVNYEDGDMSVISDNIIVTDDGEGNVTIGDDALTVMDDGDGNVTIGDDVLTVIEDGEGNVILESDNLTVTDDGTGNVTIESDFLMITDDGEGNVCITFADSIETLPYYMNGLSFEDYEVKPIGKVQLRQNEEDVGTVFPDTAEECNTYIITGNYLLTATAAEDLEPVAEALHEQLKGVTYTPCKVSIPANLQIRAGHTVEIIDSNGKAITMYVMTRTQAGQRDTLECTGSHIRASSTAVNNQTFQAYMGKVLNLRTDVDGLKAENKDAAGNLARLEMDLQGISTQVANQDGKIGELQTQIKQDAESIAFEIGAINKALEEGVTKFDTKTGFTFNKDGLRVEKTGSEMSSLIDETGMTVSRSGRPVLQATASGVNAVDVTVNNYLQVGDHARFEDYTNGADSRRTACFFT